MVFILLLFHVKLIFGRTDDGELRGAMQSKLLQRFRQWRDVNADSEQNYFQTALLISNYVESIHSLETIRDDFQNGPDSEVFIGFERFGARTRGAILFAKLVVDDALEQLHVGEINQELQLALNELRDISAYLYEQKKPSTADIQKLLTVLNNILDLDDAVFTDKALTARLILTLSLLLNLVEPTLKSLSGWLLTLVSYVIPIAEIRKNISLLIQKVESKAHLVTPAPEPTVALDVLSLAHASFNQRYLSLLIDTTAEVQTFFSASPEEKINSLQLFTKLALLHDNIQKTSAELTRLVRLRHDKQTLERHIKALTSLMQAVKENEQRTSGRAYFLDFIQRNSAEYQLFLDTLQDSEQLAFHANVERLIDAHEKKTFSLKVAHGLSWLSAPVIYTYRSLVPQWVQETGVALMPATLDSECKIMLKELLIKKHAELTQQFEGQEQEINYLTEQLFPQDEALQRQVLLAPTETLLALQKTAQKTSHAVQAYRTILNSVKENIDFLHHYQAQAQTLAVFIQLNNTFWIKLSNFFAQICWLFKTDAARMMDAVIQCKAKVDELSSKYQIAIDNAVQQIDNDATVDARIKAQLKTQVGTEISQKPVPVIDTRASEGRFIRLLVNRLDKLLAANPQPVIEHYAPSQLIDEEALFSEEGSPACSFLL